MRQTTAASALEKSSIITNRGAQKTPIEIKETTGMMAVYPSTYWDAGCRLALFRRNEKYMFEQNKHRFALMSRSRSDTIHRGNFRINPLKDENKLVENIEYFSLISARSAVFLKILTKD